MTDLWVEILIKGYATVILGLAVIMFASACVDFYRQICNKPDKTEEE